MKSEITCATMDWSIEREGSSRVVYDNKKASSIVKLPMSAEIDEGTIEILSLEIGLDLGLSAFSFVESIRGQMVPLIDIKTEAKEPMLFMASPLKGRCILKMLPTEKDFAYSEGNVLFHYADKMYYLPLLDSTTDIEVVSLKAEYGRLESLLGANLTKSLVDVLDITSAPYTKVKPIPLHITQILLSGMSNQFEGDMRKLNAQAKILEYLMALCEHLLHHDENAQQPHTKLMRHIHDELIHLEGKVPSLEEIARRYELSVKTLNNAFSKTYGKTLYRFITEHRLKKAHEAIYKTDIAQKTLANQLGYSHVNHFNSAFKRQFGYSPGSLRKKNQKPSVTSTAQTNNL